MAGFVRKATVTEDERKLAHLEVKDLALNASNEVIGQGSSASVYKFLLRGKIAAAKQFHVHLTRKSIVKAATTLIKLKHENVCRLRGLSYRPAVLLFEYCFVDIDGQLLHNLRELLSLFNENLYFNFKERLGYGLQIAEGVNYLHHEGLVHRDLKPSNVLISGVKEDIILKLADFNEVCNFKTLMTKTSTSSNLTGLFNNKYVLANI